MGRRSSMTVLAVADVTCLGCGCACDDINVLVNGDRIEEAQNACPLGREWFGDGALSSAIHVDGREATLDTAVGAAANRLGGGARPLVYIAPGISSEAQREAASIADLLRARLDTVTSATTLPLIVAAQERGFASATFGEIRNRADVIVFWAIDVAGRYPRFESRYAPGPSGTHVPGGRRDRRVIAVDVGSTTCTATDVDRRFSIGASDELALLTALQVLARQPTSTVTRLTPADGEPIWTLAREIAALLLAGRYVALVFDAEPDQREARSSARFDAILALSHALNDQARCATIALRAGGNRSGADAALTAQTGFPLGVDLSRGYPRYDAFADSASGASHVLIAGDASAIPRSKLDAFRDASMIAIGPHASRTPFGAASIAIDTGVAGIHCSGTAYRADDVPLSLRAPLNGGLSTTEVLRSLAKRLSHARASRMRAEPVTSR